MIDPTLSALSAAYPALTWSRRRGRGCTRYHGRSPDFRFPLVTVKVTDGREGVDCIVSVPYVGRRSYGYAYGAVPAVARAVANWRTDAARGEAVVAKVFGGGS